MNTEEATNFYVSIVKISQVLSIRRQGADGTVMGTSMGTSFRLDGQEFMALNGGPAFQFTEAISLCIDCASQHEVDELWEKLSSGGQKGRCGWLKDRYGRSWQIIPSARCCRTTTHERAKGVMQAMMQMTKIDIAKRKQT